ncbi:MAG: DNA-3-methyladenine glycosylase 2 family protein [Rhizobiales bacterium]|nr:DNA-3-methyladenine glycosylase 2 family protein [Hyphomicrobiales bacterium]
MRTLECDADIEAAVTNLITVEPRFAAVIAIHGHPPLRRMNAGLEGLLRIVTDQLISLQAGAAIWRRIETKLAPFDAGTIARKREATLMKLGLSGAKARSFKAVASAVADGRLDFPALAKLSDTDVLTALTKLKGIGPWTADIFLLSAMGRTDAWPAGDLALQAAAQNLFSLAARPSDKDLAQMAEPWKPWRGVAARLLWSHYRGLKGMSQTVG